MILGATMLVYFWPERQRTFKTKTAGLFSFRSRTDKA